MFGSYAITGIPLVDAIFTLIIKCMAAYFIIIMISKCIENYRKGNMAQFFVNVVVGILLLVMIVGIDTVAGWVPQLKNNLPK
ncbi:hypothetical protein [Paenibacillus macquariensis]|uniref:Uncharacterized protein n=1 Tax=Paenibacillus macquariensis TaxID=948756 RepID=A0ABY1KHA6_9BACL|nr:hypothetical protein [Paenibacillus macquariensis]OAB28404.1 hypothetical protein PMSM_24420 [Paenibacillus macquariensis subsp. macquariensis]SIR71554.1 hypothetical protein SAMN05421578_1425 [Paenibacillus macquariensis]